MNDDAAAALMFAWEQGLFDFHRGSVQRCYNASPLPGATPQLMESLECEQGNRSGHDLLYKNGYQVVPELDAMPGSCDLAVVFAAREKQKNMLNITRAWQDLRTGGQLVVAGAKTYGIQPLRKWLSGETAVTGSIAKHHCVVFAASRTDADLAYKQESGRQEAYGTAPGAFSADGPDSGSQLLAACFDGRIQGRVADFGAGWGFLSRELLGKSTGVTGIELYETEYSALKAARKNLSENKNTSIEYHWCDLLEEPPVGKFDWVIMNPPFHQGRRTDPELGKAFIRLAAGALVYGGRLLMVANRKLPYERELASSFRETSVLTEQSGYKVIEAAR